MWVLVFIYFYEARQYVETYDTYNSMSECFEGRDTLASDVGKGDGYFKKGQQAVCINFTK
jgi:hypothetical protein